MAQIFILGSSNVYGVGGEYGGWADLVKQEIHTRMYGKNGIGEKIEVYNFGFSGATVDFVIRTFPQQIKEYGRSRNIIAVVSVGGNNSKAQGTLDNYFSTPDHYQKDVLRMFELLKKSCNHVLVVNGSGFYDELKTMPFVSPKSGKRIYFSNNRKKLFDDVLIPLCREYGFPYIDVEISKNEWIKKYSYTDGLHPNSKGHEHIYKCIMKELIKVV